MSRTPRIVATLCLALLCSACTSEIYHNLDERQANEMVVSLEQHGVEAQKRPDPLNKEGWMLTVPSGSRVQAFSVLKAEGLPRPKAEGFGAFYPSKGLIPTSNEEHVLLQYATGQELRRGLLTVDRVVDVHVNLVMPKRSRVRLSRDAPEQTRASVLIKYRAPTPEAKAPLTIEQVKQLIVGGVPEIEAKHISVVLTPDVQKPLLDPQLQQIGPVAVSAASKTSLQLIISVMCLVIVLLGAALGFVILRRRPNAEAAS